jgi:asparagine synthase (glutamine-hydrolysing)
MSVQFGTCKFDGKPVDPQDFDEVRPVLAPYGPDGEGCLCKDSVGVFYRALYNTRESRLETQPLVTASGAIVTWDGRLDNREELIRRLGCDASSVATDPGIVAAAYERWGSESFAKLIGDWALSIWDERARSLILAKDFSGTRHLYFHREENCVTWCTILDPLVQFAGHRFELEEEYIAGWLSSLPAPHLTPFAGIHSVRPACYTIFSRDATSVIKYWDFDPGKKIRYRSDSDYEEHFRIVFAESVGRRLRSHFPVLAELSGGMDSSSIVCMADEIIRWGSAPTSRLDTISYYDDSEANWNERPYFTEVEKKTGRTGKHVDVSSQRYFQFNTSGCPFAATPASTHWPSEASRALSASILLQGSRTLLSGIGGDEFMGGVPNPLPELTDHLATGKFVTFFRQLESWALYQRKPCFYLLAEIVKSFLRPAFAGSRRATFQAPWLGPKLTRKPWSSFSDHDWTQKLPGSLPSFEETRSALSHTRRQMETAPLPENPAYERRYPYLDRDLLEFVCAIPPEQLVRPGHRRSLMRRALAGIVPGAILNRKRKALVMRGPVHALSREKASVKALTEHMLAASMGFLEPSLLERAIQKGWRGGEISVMQLLRTLELECWLRGMAPKLVNGEKAAASQATTSLSQQVVFTASG